MKKKIISIPLLLISYLCLNAQQENGTILLDHATSKTYVVTNAFLNASNDVHDLIQNVSPTPDFTTNNQTLVDTIVDVANAPDLSDFELKSELTNDVCAIVTNVSADWSCELGNLVRISSNFWRGYWYGVFIELRYASPYWTIQSDGGFFLDETVEGSADATHLMFRLEEGSESATTLGTTYIELVRRNAIGLARLSDISPSVSNTVTKSYIESLGIESGISASTASNISYSVTTNYVYNELTNRPTREEMDDGWWGEWKVSGIGDYIFVSITYHDNSMVGGTKYWVLAYIIPNDGPYDAECDGDENSTTLTFSARDKLVTATRHRVASPIPTKISEISNDVGFVTSSVTNGLITSSITNGLIGADYIATNNAAFVAAVTNCPVVIASADAEALTEWGIYGGGGTIGALLAALAAAVAALKKSKIPMYQMVDVSPGDDSVTVVVPPFVVATIDNISARQEITVAVGSLPQGVSGVARDAVLVIDCSEIMDGDQPTVTWGTHFHPRTDAGTDFACEAAVRNVYYISEYAAGEFAVGGWVETEGGNT